MINFLDIPEDLILNIFFYISPTKTRHIIENLLKHPSKDSLELVDLLYTRLFSGKLLISDNSDSGKYTLLGVGEFKDKFYKNNEETKAFLSIRPNELQVSFIRNSHDYSDFIGQLYDFNHLLEFGSKEFKNYMDRCLQVNLLINGNIAFTESPKSLTVIVLQLLINASCSFMSNRIRELIIKRTDIGDSYISQWGQLLSRFENLKRLNLSDNLIRSGYHDTTDVLKTFQFPAGLEHLCLDNNFISRVSEESLQNFPRSLKSLLLRNNNISIIDLPLKDRLPDLKLLDLQNCHQLEYIEVRSLSGMDGLTILIRGCHLSNFTELQSAALRCHMRIMT